MKTSSSEGEGGWERELYALETAVSLGWALEDEPLKSEAIRRVEALLLTQDEEGWFGPAACATIGRGFCAARAAPLF